MGQTVGQTMGQTVEQTMRQTVGQTKMNTTDAPELSLLDMLWPFERPTGDYADSPIWANYLELYWYVRIPCIISYVVTFIVGVLGNSLVIWIAGFKMESISAVWFLNLAITDLICNLALPIRITEWVLVLQNVPYTTSLCKASTAVMFFNMLTSVYFLTIISIDRFVSIMWPLWGKIHRTPQLAGIISVITWVVCLMITVPHTVFYNTIDDMSECYPKYYDSLLEYGDASLYVILTTKFVSMFAVPFCIILICNGLIACKLRTVRRRTGSRQPFKVITAIVVCFFICWCPYNIWPLIILNEKYWKVDVIIVEITVCLAYFNSCINPIIYVFFCKDFKDNFIKSLPAKLEDILNDRPEANCKEVCPLNVVSSTDLIYNRPKVV
ncbi:N-formyl peptide receptor 3-like [Pelodytes ibericus]